MERVRLVALVVLGLLPISPGLRSPMQAVEAGQALAGLLALVVQVVEGLVLLLVLLRLGLRTVVEAVVALMLLEAPAVARVVPAS